MSNNNWKSKFQRPNRRTLVYSNKLDKFLPEEDIPVLEMAHDKRSIIMNKLMETDTTLTKEQAQGLAEQMLSNPEAAKKILEDFEDEPEAKEEQSADKR